MTTLKKYENNSKTHTKKGKVYFLRLSVLYIKTVLNYVRNMFLCCSEENEEMRKITIIITLVKQPF